MKKDVKKFGKLSLNKETLTNIVGGHMQGYSVLPTMCGDCTDGCTGTGSGGTMWNCTDGNCTNDCGTLVCDTDSFCTTVANTNGCGNGR